MSSSLVLRSNMWLERNGLVVLSEWRVSLLEAIDELGSISAAAEKLQVPYHRAWDRLQEMEQGLGVALLDRQAGGQSGGGARLTPAGADYVARFRRFNEGLNELISQRFAIEFGS